MIEFALIYLLGYVLVALCQWLYAQWRDRRG